jgi:hypothetical protein
MANIKRANTSGITKSGVAIPDVPDAPTIGAATNVGTSRAFNNGSATVAFTAAATGGTPASYTATSTPGSFTASGAGSPLTVTGLQSATSYTFAVTGTNASATGAASASSSSITATTVPQAPTIGTPTVASGQSYTGSANVSVPFTAGATGGASVSTYTVTSSSGGTATGASSPISISDTVGTARTYTVTATNANGTSTASSASASTTPVSVPQASTIGTASRTNNTTVSLTFTAGATGGSSVTSYTVTSSPSISLSTSGTSSPLTVTGTFVSGTAYTFSITATNAQGTSSASSASNSITPYPLPTLGAWTQSTAYPGSSIYGPQGYGNTASLWVGTGYTYDGDTNQSISAAYKWIGSSWSTSSYPVAFDGIGVGRLNTTTADSALAVGGYNRQGYYTFGVYSYSPNDGWTGRTNYPYAAAWVGVAALNQSVNVRVFGNAGQATSLGYYITSLSGSWTSTGVTNPNSSRYYGIDNNFGGEGWFWSNNSSVYPAYKVTSLTSAYSTITTPPWDYPEYNLSTTVVNGIVLLFPNRSTYPNPYSFNGSTYTAQTIFPGTPGSVAGGAFTSTQYRLVNTYNNSQHYVATMS